MEHEPPEWESQPSASRSGRLGKTLPPSAQAGQILEAASVGGLLASARADPSEQRSRPNPVRETFSPHVDRWICRYGAFEPRRRQVEEFAAMEPLVASRVTSTMATKPLLPEVVAERAKAADDYRKAHQAAIDRIEKLRAARMERDAALALETAQAEFRAPQKNREQACKRCGREARQDFDRTRERASQRVEPARFRQGRRALFPNEFLCVSAPSAEAWFAFVLACADAARSPVCSRTDRHSQSRIDADRRGRAVR